MHLKTLAVLLLLASLSGRPASGRSLLDQLAPFGTNELASMLRQGGQMVETLREGAALAYEDLASSFSDFVAQARQGGPRADGPPRDCNQTEPEDDESLFACAPPDPDEGRTVSEIIRSRGFLAEEHEVTTRDDYILTVQRIVNPLVAAADRARLKPIILQHGLMSSSVDWVINSPDVRPAKWPRAAASAATQEEPSNSIEAHQASNARRPSAAAAADSQDEPNSLAFYLANQGYDVYLANSRGNVYGQRHVHLSSWQPAFWDFTFDEQIAYDLPDTIELVQRLTNHTKVAYVGHSQGTTMALGLLADRPEYADVLEPVVLLAPVAYVNHCLSPVRHFSLYTPLFQHVNMWFGSSNAAVRYLAPKVCGPKMIRRNVCANIIFLSCGFDEAQFNESRASAYLSHMPSGTSVKNIAHWGQEVNSGRFAHFDHGILGNQARYQMARAPDYDLAKIRSKALVLFTAENDWLASPKDVERLKRELTVAPHLVVNMTELVPAWNHIDFLYGIDCGRLVNTRVLEALSHFDDRHHA